MNDEMSPEDKQALVAYWESQLEMMGSEAWQEFVKETQENIRLTSNVMSIPDGDTLNNVKGQLRILQSIVVRQDTARKVLDHLEGQ